MVPTSPLVSGTVPSQRNPSDAANNSTETHDSGNARNITNASARSAYSSASMSFFGYWLPSQPQIIAPAILNRPTSPIAQPPSSMGETGVPKNDMPTALSEMYEGRWSPMNVT